MKKKVIANPGNVFPKTEEEALSVKSNEAYQSYLSDLKEVEDIFKDAIKGKSISLDFNAKSKDELMKYLD